MHELLNEDPRMKIYFTGGSDCPAIETHLFLQTEVKDQIVARTPPKNTIVFRYHALHRHTHKGARLPVNRQPIPFNPAGRVDFDADPVFPGPTTFPLALRNLRWARGERRKLTISWETEGAEEFALHAASTVPNDLPESTVNTFLQLKRGRSLWGSPDRIEVVCDWNAYLEYKYRSMLASDPTAKIFWRECQEQQTYLQTVPNDLYRFLNMRTDPMYTFDAKRMNGFLKKEGSQRDPIKDMDDVSGASTALVIRDAWGSDLEAEYALKVPILYELDGIEELNTELVNGAWTCEAFCISDNNQHVPPRK